VCPWHHSASDVTTGQMVRGPQGAFAKVPGLALSEVAAAGFPDPGDRQMLSCAALAFRTGGRGKPGIGGEEHAQPLRPARAEPVHQVMQVVAGSCPVESEWLDTSPRRDSAR
jgi:hypothetical protein